MATPTWIRKTLQSRGIAFEELHHPAAYTAQEVAHNEQVSGRRVAKVVVALVDGRPVELILPATRRVRLDRVRDLFGAREVRLATEKEMGAIFGDCETGAIPPLRHWENVEVLMDLSLDQGGKILFQAGTHKDAIRLWFEDWLEMVRPRVASFSEPPELFPPEYFCG